MNETERDRILRMVAEGTLRPHEAAHLLAALADEREAGNGKGRDGKKEKDEKKAAPLMEVQLERADGSHYTVKVPPSLVPMLWEITKATVRESARSAAQDTWDGLKTIVKKKSGEVATSVRGRLSPGRGRTAIAPPPPRISEPERQAALARRQVLEMVQQGTITADAAGRLIHQIDAHELYRRSLERETAPAGR